MSSVVISGDSSGAITLQAPSVAGTTTLTLPATSGTLITTASSGQSIPSLALPVGSVLQVVQSTYSTTQQISNSTSLFDSGLTATITPKSSTSKILVLVAQNTQIYINNNTFQSANLNICRGTTVVYTYNSCMAMQFPTGSNGYQDMYQTIGMQYLDSPATTSPVTYKTQGQINNISGTAGLRFQYVGSSIMTLLEIAA